MWRDDSAPRTAAERLRAARRDEITALYAQSCERHNNSTGECYSLSESRAHSRSALDTPLSCGVGRGGQFHERGVPEMRRLTQGEYQNPTNMEMKCQQANAEDRIQPSTTTITAAAVDAYRTSTSCNATPSSITPFERPLRVFNANWSRTEMPRKRHWCSYGTPHAVATAMKPTTMNGMRVAPVLSLRPASVSTMTRAITPTTPRSRPGSSASVSSFHTANTTKSMSGTGTEAVRNRRSFREEQQQRREGSYKGKSREPRQSNSVGGGGLLLSKDEYRRICELITPL